MLPTGSNPWATRARGTRMTSRWDAIMGWSKDNLSLGKVFWWLGWAIGLTAIAWHLLTYYI